MGRAIGLAALLLSGAVGQGAATRDQDANALGPEAFFGLTNLYEFHLKIEPDQWARMETYAPANPSAEGRPGFGGPGPGGRPGGPPMMDINFQEGRATLEFQGRLWGDIQVRFKGNSSFNAARHSLKRSFKLDFNDLEDGATFFGMTKLNLNNNAMDPVQMREALAYEVARQAGLPASRTAFAKVFITVPGRHNRHYAGLYTVVEQVDERFLKSRFATKQGLLLKPERTQGLPYLGDDWQAYTNRLEPKTKVKAAEAERFIKFARLLNQAAEDAFHAQAAGYMDVEEFLRFLAVQTVLANLDSPLLTGHNYYLYVPPLGGKMVWIPWDLNETFGGFMGGGDATQQADLSIDRSFAPGNRLAERVLAMPGAKKKYHEIMRGLITTNFTTARMTALIEAISAVIVPALKEDLTVSPAYFQKGLSGDSTGKTETDVRQPFPPPGPGGRQRPALKPFVTNRVESIEKQLAGQSTGYEPQMTRPPGMGGPGPAGGPGFGPRPFFPQPPRER